MNIKYRWMIVGASVRNRIGEWVKVMVIIGIAMILLMVSGTIYRSISSFFNDYMLGGPEERCIEVGYPGQPWAENTDETETYHEDTSGHKEELRQLMKKNEHIVEVFARFDSFGLKISNLELLDQYNLNKNSANYGEVLCQTDQFYDDRYLKSGRWIKDGEKNVIVIPENFAPNLEDDLGTWDFKQEDVNGRELIGKTLKFTCSDNGKERIYSALVVGTYDNIRSNSNASTVILSKKDIQLLLNQYHVNQEEIDTDYTYYSCMVDDRENVEAVFEFLDQRITSPEKDIYIKGIPGILQEYAELIRIAGLAFGFLLFLLSFAVVSKTIKRMIENRTSEIGLYKAIGYTSKQIRANIFHEIFAVLIITFAASIAISAVIVLSLYCYFHTNGSLLIESISLKVEWMFILLCIVLGGISITVGGLVGLRPIRKLEVIEALRK